MLMIPKLALAHVGLHVGLHDGHGFAAGYALIKAGQSMAARAAGGGVALAGLVLAFGYGRANDPR